MNIYGKIAGKAEPAKPNSLNEEENVPEITQTNYYLEDDPLSNSFQNKQEVSIPRQVLIGKNENDGLQQSGQLVPTQKQIIQEEFLQQEKILKDQSEHQEQILQSSWNNCVLLTTNDFSIKELIEPESKTDLYQEILINYMAFKVFENEDQINESLYWKKLLKIPTSNNNANNIEKLNLTKYSLWDKIEIKEQEIRAQIASDSSYVEKLLLKFKQKEKYPPGLQPWNDEKVIHPQNFIGRNPNSGMEFFSNFQRQHQNSKLIHQHQELSTFSREFIRENNIFFSPNSQSATYFNSSNFRTQSWEDRGHLMSKHFLPQIASQRIPNYNF